MRKAIPYIFLYIFSLVASLDVLAQPGTSIDIKKPDKYERRVLGAEKTGQKKFTFSKRFFQNTYTHFNYYFNANNILNDIVENARKANENDYTRLLPFYGYSLDVTSQSGDLDSVIYKCNAGILLHDLRNDWVDDMYLLLGKAYFYRKNFDSASEVFRYINYAFAPKEEGGYDIPVGSNISNTNGVFSIATKENNKFPKSLVNKPPSRNDALLWQARTYLVAENYGEAGGLLEILSSDPIFPKRLKPNLHELSAYWYYVQQGYDSAAEHLSKALDAADTKAERARMEFLTAQLYEQASNKEKAVDWYAKAGAEATDPIMEVYANLNSIKAARDSSGKMAKEKLDNLLKMAHRDKYFGYRDIIYYVIAQVELDRNDTAAAQDMLNKSVRYGTEENPRQKSKSFLLLADINYDQHQYIASKNFYDSVDVGSLADDKETERVNQRQQALGTIAANLEMIHKQDSLQTVAAMPKDERDALVRKTVRMLRKQQGMSEEQEINVNPAVLSQAPTDIFNSSATSSKDWYFNNLAIKSNGYNQFRAKWGNRPNADNWRRRAALSAKPTSVSPVDSTDEDVSGDASDDMTVDNIDNEDSTDETTVNDEAANGEITFESLYEDIPLTEEKLKASNARIAEALFKNGQTFQDQLEDYPSAINAYEELLRKHKDYKNKEEALFNLYYCYNKTGRRSSADSAKTALTREFANGQWAAKLNNPPAKQSASDNDPATLKYKEIYNLFIEGKFEQAKTEKAKADSIYDNSHWTPQLLYIEAVYYVSVKDDSAAIDRLTQLNEMYGDSPLAEKAATMIDVLRRRGEIENYLTNLKIERYKEDEEAPIVNLTPVKPTFEKVQVTRDSVVSNNVTQVAKTKVDTTSAAPPVVRKFEFNPKDSQYVVVMLDQVAPVYVNEAKNAFNRFNGITFYNQKLNITPVKLNDRYNLVLIGPFIDAVAAVNYVDKTKPVTTSRILPWLTAEKYSYSIISQNNLDVLKDTKDVDGYKSLLEKVLPGKF